MLIRPDGYIGAISASMDVIRDYLDGVGRSAKLALARPSATHYPQRMVFDPETVDLAPLTGEIAQAFGGQPPAGYLLGRTAIRDAVVLLLGCSQLQAEEIVDTLVARAFLVYEGAPTDSVDELQAWSFRP